MRFVLSFVVDLCPKCLLLELEEDSYLENVLFYG